MDLQRLIVFCDKNGIQYKLNEPMSAHTSFKIGGAADIFISLSDSETLSTVITECKTLGFPYFIIGKGSNLLVSDEGIAGAVISLSGMNVITAEDEKIICGAGASLSEICRAALDNGLSGLEFAYGIPGTLGGALFMNAGAYGGEMKDVVLSAECLTESGEIITVNASDMELGYRKSIFKTNKMVVLSAVLGLKRADKSEIYAKMQDYIARRRDKQPLEYPSAGSFFKRPEGNFAGTLIEKNGLKGLRVGGAEVSVKHAGFVVNRGGATAEDVKELSCQIIETVEKADGITLEREVIFIGRE